MDAPLDDAVFRSLLEAAPDGILIADAEGIILAVNKQVERLFGFERSDLLGQSVDLLVPEKLRDVHRGHRGAYNQQPMTRPMGIGLDLAGRRKDGSEMPLAISLSPAQLGSGPVIIATIRDISERIRLTAERDALRVAFETEQERHRIGMDLHDGIMQDVYAVSLGLEMALADLEDDPTRADQALNKAIDDLHGVVRDIRNFIFDLRPRRFRGQLSDALLDLGREFEDNTTIRTAVSVPSSRVAVADEVAVAVYHVAHEALSNVRKHSQADQVEILLETGREGIRVEITDNGSGFDTSQDPEESHRGLRNMFARAKAAGGQLDVSSKPGQGTSISVRFPDHPQPA